MKNSIAILLILFSTSILFAQGCSDAGICSISKSFETKDRITKNSIDFGTVYSLGEADVTYISPYITYTRQFSDKFSLSTKFTASSANGNFGTRASFGDGFLIGNYSFKEVKNKQFSALFGFKFPFNSSNLKINGYSLPLDYQSSLGTFDLFVGGNFKVNNFDFNTALQIPIINNNKNSYFKEFSGSTVFPSTNLFERKPDALFRATYTLKTTSNKFVFKPNMLLIYHLGEDSYENVFGNRVTISGSEGLTVNANIISAYEISKNKSIELSLATPLAIRTIRPDGLTRSFVVGLQYHYSF